MIPRATTHEVAALLRAERARELASIHEAVCRARPRRLVCAACRDLNERAERLSNAAIPGIYGELSAQARAAYRAWMGALIEKGEHLIDCSECLLGAGECGTGIALHEAEQRVWSVWNEARRSERK